MNDLAMGPLPARVKSETGVLGKETVFRCGVRDCPEVFGIIRHGYSADQFLFFELYTPNQNGVYVVTRRSARRFKEEREYMAQRAETWAGARKIAAKHSKKEPELEPEVEEMIRRDEEDFDPRKNEHCRFPLESAFPIVAKCARCGRLSKIEKANKKA